MCTKDIIQQVLSKMGFECELKAKDNFINIQVQEPSLLIGHNGQNIRALQYLIKLILIKNYKIIPEFNLDINNYRQQRIDIIKKIAQDSVYRATILKKEVILKPMSSYERRIVHMMVSIRKDANALSQGIEPNRRVVITPV